MLKLAEIKMNFHKINDKKKKKKGVTHKVEGLMMVLGLPATHQEGLKRLYNLSIWLQNLICGMGLGTNTIQSGSKVDNGMGLIFN